MASTVTIAGFRLSSIYRPRSIGIDASERYSEMVNGHRGGGAHLGIDTEPGLVSFKYFGHYPVTEVLEDRTPFPEVRWQIAPRAAGAGNPQHRLDKAPIIGTAAPRVA